MQSLDIQGFSYEERHGSLPILTSAFAYSGGRIAHPRTLPGHPPTPPPDSPVTALNPRPGPEAPPATLNPASPAPDPPPAPSPVNPTPFTPGDISPRLPCPSTR